MYLELRTNSYSCLLFYEEKYGHKGKVKKELWTSVLWVCNLRYAPTFLNRKPASQPEDFQKRYNASFSLKVAQLRAVKNGGPKKYLYVFLSKKDA